MERSFDFIIVGAGAAGCVMAYRLVKHGFTVALIDAGGNYNDNYQVEVPFNFGNLWGDVTYSPPYNPAWNEWSFPSVSGEESMVYNYVRASCLGGCASHHAMVGFRGKPRVYDEWARLTKDESWQYKNLIPYFEKVEKIYPGNCATTHGGRNGWLSLTHSEPELMDLELLSAMTNDFHFTYRENTTEDENGVGFWNFMITPDGKRSNSSISLLSSILKDPRLIFFSDSLVTRLLWKNTTVVGVEMAKGRTLYKANTEYQSPSTPPPLESIFCNNEVLLCGGAINSPQILMLSGIGPREELEALGIEVVMDLPQVGKNLLDHPEMWNNYELSGIKHRWQTYFPFDSTSPVYNDYQCWNVGPYKVPFSSIGLNTTVSANADLHIGIYTIPSNNFNTAEWFNDYDFVGKTYASFLIEHSNPSYSGGYLKLVSNSPYDMPYINEELNTDENATAIAEGVLLMRSIIQSQTQWSPKEVYPSSSSGDPLDFEQLREFFKTKSAYGHHISGTCAMNTVVDSKLNVKGIKKLRVVDASIFPTIVSANPSLPIYMIAEKTADILIKQYERCKPRFPTVPILKLFEPIVRSTSTC